MSTLAPDGLSIKLSNDEQGVALTLSGCADSLALSSLTTAVEQIRQAAEQKRPPRVTVDLRQLEFMNSSCFKIFVTWLSKVRELPTVDRYQVEFLSDPLRHWQRRSLAALTAFGGDLAKVIVDGKVVGI